MLAAEIQCTDGAMPVYVKLVTSKAMSLTMVKFPTTCGQRSVKQVILCGLLYVSEDIARFFPTHPMQGTRTFASSKHTANGLNSIHEVI